MSNLVDLHTVYQNLLEIVRARPEDDDAKLLLTEARQQLDDAWASSLERSGTA